jgi:GntR family transcriptional regulator
MRDIGNLKKGNRKMNTSLDNRPDHIRTATVIVDLGNFLPKALATTDTPNAPKHVQLSRALVRALSEGIVREGDKLPSESILTEMTPYSLGTVQKAMKWLVQYGFVTRTPGIGTIVNSWQNPLSEPLHCRFAHKNGDFVPVYSSIINRVPIDGAGPWNEVLGNNRRIFRIDRSIRIDDKFSVFSYFYVNVDRQPIFETLALSDFDNNNFKTLMYQQSGDSISHLDQRVTFVKPNKKIARYIGVDKETTVLQLKVSARTLSGENIYYQEFFIPPNDFDLQIDSHLDGLSAI